MKRLWIHDIVLYISFIALLSSISGCATLSLNGGNKDSAEIVYSKELQDAKDTRWPDKALRQTFEDYWLLRFGGEVQKIFSMEAPYVQFMVEPDRYEQYAQGAKQNDLKVIQISGIDKITEYNYTVHFTSRFVTKTGEEKEVYRNDEWVKAGGNWYHVLRDFIMFRDLG